ncbi:MAG: WhiB family transcriptional regulator, redox-sensing transcriptional regulator [Pseudonocardia sp.]|jgi:WhiB family redox-sensing transcriptional regulator
MTWRERAACRTEDPELFFPVGIAGPALDQLIEAKSVCHRCPVAAECLAWALDTGQRAGVWGGLSEDERYQLQQRDRPIFTRPYQVSVSARTDASIGVERPGSGSGPVTHSSRRREA